MLMLLVMLNMQQINTSKKFDVCKCYEPDGIHVKQSVLVKFTVVVAVVFVKK